ncbi:hypothetical protein EON83_03795 [bacterium]|nr:MAG: hypothetical protein EON83_03795 [bacterium]
MRIPFRGVIAFVLIWAVLWAVPAFRSQNLQALHPQGQGYNYWENPSVSKEEIAKAVKAHPNDAYLQSQLLEWNVTANQKKEIDRYYGAFDALIERFPNDLGIRRARLRLSTRGNIVPAKYSNRFVKSSFTLSAAPLWMDRSQLEKVVAQAQAAQKIDSRDGFFPWIEAMALWGLGKEGASLLALERAGKCPAFNDGSTDEVHRKLALLSGIRQLDWDEKMGVFWSTLFPHFAGMRGLAREVCYSGIEQYRAGNKAEAWRRWNIAMKAGRVLRVSQKNSSIIGILVGEAIESLSWGIAAEGASGYQFTGRLQGGSSRASTAQRSSESLAAFIRAAKRDGHSDLGQWALQESKEFAARQTVLPAKMDFLDEKLGWNKPLARATLQLRWIGAYAMLWAAVGIGSWLLSLLISWGGRNTRVGANTVVLLTAFFGMLWLGMALLALLDGAGVKSYGSILQFGGGGLSTSQLGWGSDWDGNFWWGVAITFGLIAVGREWGARRSAYVALAAQDETRTKRPDVWQWAGSAVWAICLLLSGILWLDGNNGAGIDSDAIILWGAWVACMVLGITIAWKTSSPQGRKQTVPVAINAVLAIMLLVLSGRTMFSDAATWICIVLFPITIGLLIWNGRRGAWSRPRILTNMETGGRVLGGVALIISVGYLVASLALLPARNQLNERVDRYVQLGEVKWLQEQTP